MINLMTSYSAHKYRDGETTMDPHFWEVVQFHGHQCPRSVDSCLEYAVNKIVLLELLVRIRGFLGARVRIRIFQTLLVVVVNAHPAVPQKLEKSDLLLSKVVGKVSVA